MNVKKRRLGFGALTAALAVLLFFFSTAYLLRALLVLAALLAVQGVLLRLDAGRMQMELRPAASGQAGRAMRVCVTVGRSGRCLAAGYAAVELEICNVMFGQTWRQRLLLSLRDGQNEFETTLTAPLCGELIFRCVSVQIIDAAGLFQAECAPFSPSRALCYPAPVEMELTLSRDTVGAADAEGLMQNRRGSDPSETFDVREYVPGDDVRAIHWKLSCKTDSLILREASEPSHYDVLLLPDLGMTQPGGKVSRDELNSAAALLVGMGEQLLERGVSFCLAIPTKRGLQLCEASDRRMFRRLLPQWLGVEIPAESGAGLQLFLLDHMEQHFTRLLIVSAGKYAQDLGALGKRIGVTVVSTADDVSAPVYHSLGPGCEGVALPSKQPKGIGYKIVC